MKYFFAWISFLLGDRTLKGNLNHSSYFVDSETEAREVKWFTQNYTWRSGWAATKPGSLASQISVPFTDLCCLCLFIQLASVIEGTLISLAPKGFCGVRLATRLVFFHPKSWVVAKFCSQLFQSWSHHMEGKMIWIARHTCLSICLINMPSVVQIRDCYCTKCIYSLDMEQLWTSTVVTFQLSLSLCVFSGPVSFDTTSYIIEGFAVLWQPKHPKKQMLGMQGADWPPHALGSWMNWHFQFMNVRSLEVWSILRSVN